MVEFSNEHYRLTTRRNGITIVNVFGFPIMHDNRSYNDHLDYVDNAIQDVTEVLSIITNGVRPKDVVYNVIDYRIGNKKKSITARIETSNRFKMHMEYLSISADTVDVDTTVHELMDMEFDDHISKYSKQALIKDTNDLLTFLKNMLESEKERVKIALSTQGD